MKTAKFLWLGMLVLAMTACEGAKKKDKDKKRDDETAKAEESSSQKDKPKASAESAPQPSATAPPTQAEIKALVTDLRDWSKKTRTETKLMGIGAPAVPAVTEHCGDVIVAFESTKPGSKGRPHITDVTSCVDLLYYMGPEGRAVLKKWRAEFPKGSIAGAFIDKKLK
jgi:hypothetical protein